MPRGIYNDFLPSLYVTWESLIQEVAWEFCLKQQLQPVTPSAPISRRSHCMIMSRGLWIFSKLSHEAAALNPWF